MVGEQFIDVFDTFYKGNRSGVLGIPRFVEVFLAERKLNVVYGCYVPFYT